VAFDGGTAVVKSPTPADWPPARQVLAPMTASSYGFGEAIETA
jgi:hypothetical protein